MTRRRQLEQHRRSLGEIREVMSSMKTLAYLETRKLARSLEAQRAVVRSIEDAAADLLAFHPEIRPEAAERPPTYLLLGSERGFCGDFNHSLLAHLETVSASHPAAPTELVAVGRKLRPLLEEDPRVAVRVDGANAAEEIPALLHAVVGELAALQQTHGMLNLLGVHHVPEGGVTVRTVLPPFRDVPRAPPAFPAPPLLQQPPRELLLELTDHYLFTALHEMLYTSLMAENRQRVAQLEGAVRRLDDELTELARRTNALRQEEIIEEIEVILLNATPVGRSRNP